MARGGGALGWDGTVAAACWRLATDPDLRATPLLLLAADLGEAPPAPLLPVAARLATPFDLTELYRAVATLTARLGAPHRSLS